MDASYVITEINSKRTGFLIENNSLVRACSLCNDSLIGSIYTAKVVNIVPSINAAFLDAGTGDYLYYSLTDNKNNLFTRHGNTDKVCVGDELIVQIAKEPMKTKKGVASSNVELNGRYIILNRSSEIGISYRITDTDFRKNIKHKIKDKLSEAGDPSLGAIIRTSAENVSIDIVIRELDKLIHTMNEIMNLGSHLVARKLIYSPDRSIKDELMDIRDRYDTFSIITDIEDEYNNLKEYFEADIRFYNDKMVALHKVFNLEERLRKGFDRFIYLKSGGSIIVEPIEALTVVDVNTGKAIKGKNTEKTFLKINKEAAETIARVIRLRNISGIIIIDFINMKSSDSIRELIEYLKTELSRDEIRVTYVDMTPLGLVELTRKKEARPLAINDFL